MRLSLINTINSIMNGPCDFDHDAVLSGKKIPGGFCGPAVKPIALNMVAGNRPRPAHRGLPALAALATGVTRWTSCTGRGQRAGLHGVWSGFKIVQEMADGLSTTWTEMGFESVGRCGARQRLRLGRRYISPEPYQPKPSSARTRCVRCGRCHDATRHLAQAITTLRGKRHFEVKEDECVGCNLCVTVCPGPELRHPARKTLMPGEVDLRTGKTVSRHPHELDHSPQQPMAKVALPEGTSDVR
jgi:dihydropyrimidine dehydrogenase (NAD+) subunit PreA